MLRVHVLDSDVCSVKLYSTRPSLWRSVTNTQTAFWGDIFKGQSYRTEHNEPANFSFSFKNAFQNLLKVLEDG